MSDRKLMSVAKDYWKISKKSTKFEKPQKNTDLVIKGREPFNKVLVAKFRIDSNVLIFDVSTFSLDQKAVKGWVRLTVRPTVPYPRGNRHYHLMLAINRDGPKATCLTKASVTTKDTVFFSVGFSARCRM